MPSRYGGKNSTATNPVRKRTTRTKPLVRRRPGMLISRKKARTRKQVNAKLSVLRTAVKRLQSSRYGQTQLDAQAFYHRGDDVHSNDTPHVYDLCAEQPLCFCVQAIRRFSALWQLKYNPAAAAGLRFNANQVGSFDKQKFAYQTLNADPIVNNDLKYKTT